MQILFTGASSFSGFWFVKELVEEGHQVTALFQRPLEVYSGLRRQRIDQLLSICRSHFEVVFGENRFMEVIDQEANWDLFCHHAAEVTDYKSPYFDVPKAISSNTKNLQSVLNALMKKGCFRLILTGSLFEQNEGAGSDQLRAVSPYGLSKGLTSDFFKYYCAHFGMRLGKFVIPNPFGPYEEQRFTSYLIESWFKGITPSVSTPLYIRDNIHISLLAKAYKHFVHLMFSSHASSFEKFNPSGYVESQQSFALRFAKEMEKRLNIACPIDCKIQEQFPEPRIRINTDLLTEQGMNWSETEAWDALAHYYLSRRYERV
jgi:nucleoside-diphosphate-sugar epimerase